MKKVFSYMGQAGCILKRAYRTIRTVTSFHYIRQARVLSFPGHQILMLWPGGWPDLIIQQMVRLMKVETKQNIYKRDGHMKISQYFCSSVTISILV